jgi:hypothetical protein
LLISKKDNKKNHQKDLIKVVLSKITCLRWHLGQIKHGSFGAPFDQIHNKKNLVFLCNVMEREKNKLWKKT